MNEAFATLAVRTGIGSPMDLARGVSKAIGTVDPHVALSFRLFSEQVARP